MTAPAKPATWLTDPRPGRPCTIIGEVAQAHDGSLGQAHAFIDAVADAGADAIKFQTHIAEAESTPAEPWRKKFSRQDATRYDYWKRMEFTEEQWHGLKAHADERGLLFLSSPFSMRAIDESMHQAGASEEESLAPEILGQAPAMQEVFRAIGRLAMSHATVLITGDSGSGKELVARALHRRRFLSAVVITTSALSLASPAADAERKPAGGAASVDGARIVAADDEPQNWLAHGRTYDEQRYSPLAKINDANVGELGLAWSYATGTTRGLQASPIVVDS